MFALVLFAWFALISIVKADFITRKVEVINDFMVPVDVYIAGYGAGGCETTVKAYDRNVENKYPTPIKVKIQGVGAEVPPGTPPADGDKHHHKNATTNPSNPPGDFDANGTPPGDAYTTQERSAGRGVAVTWTEDQRDSEFWDGVTDMWAPGKCPTISGQDLLCSDRTGLDNCYSHEYACSVSLDGVC
eukprot:gene31023-38342_t